MAKTKKGAVKPRKPSLTSKIVKRKSLKRIAAITPKLKKLSLAQAKPKIDPKMLKFSTSEEPSGSENESDVTVVNASSYAQSPRHFIQAAESPIDLNQVESGVKALFGYINLSSAEKTELFDDEQPIFLQITSIKVPKTPNRQVRLTLKHSLLPESGEVCLIVKDVGKARDHDGTIEHYEELLNNKGVTNIKTVMPYHQFKTEYGNQYELVRKLLGLYDYFLVDGSIGGYVTHRLGKIFLEKRKMPTPVKMDATNLKEHFEISLRKTLMKLHAKSDYYIVQVGHTKMGAQEVFDNVSAVIEELGYAFPGGLDNIRSLGVKTAKSITVPLYLTLKNKSTVKVPVALAKRPRLFKKVTGELTTFLDKDVTVLPTGEIIVTDQGQEDEQFDLDLEDEQFILSDVEDDEDGRLSGGSDEEVDDLEEEDMKSKEQVMDKPAEDEEEDGGILDQAEEMYLNQYEQEQTKTRKTKKTNQDLSENEEVPAKRGKRAVNTKTTSKQAVQKANKQKATKIKKQESSKELKEDGDGDVLAQAEELYLNEYEQEQTLAKNTRKTRANKNQLGKQEVPLKETKKPAKKTAEDGEPLTKITKTKTSKAGKKDPPNILEQEKTKTRRARRFEKTEIAQGKNVEEVNVTKTRKTKAQNTDEVVPAKKTRTVKKVPEEPATKSKGKTKMILAVGETDTKNLKKSRKKEPVPSLSPEKVEEKSKKGLKKTVKPKEVSQTITKKVDKLSQVSGSPVGKKSKKVDKKKNAVQSQKEKKSPTLKVKKGKSKGH